MPLFVQHAERQAIIQKLAEIAAHQGFALNGGVGIEHAAFELSSERLGE